LAFLQATQLGLVAGLVVALGWRRRKADVGDWSYPWELLNL